MEEAPTRRGHITALLLDFSHGNLDAYNRLFPLVYEHLGLIARNQLARRPADGALRKTELIHEAYMKLIDQSRTQWKDRAHFYTVAAKAMRHILVDHHRKQKAQKRGGSKEVLSLDDDEPQLGEYAEHLDDIHDLMEQLGKVNDRMSVIVDLRVFAGFTVEEVAGLLNVSTSTVDRDWKTARGWLYQQLVQG